MSTAARFRSSSDATISSSVSPSPSIRLVFVSTSAAMALREREHGERLPVAGTRVADRRVRRFDGLEILREHVEAGVDDRRDVGKLAREIRCQRLDGRMRARAP